MLLTLTLTLTPTTDPPKRFPYSIPYVSLRQKPRVVYWVEMCSSRMREKEYLTSGAHRKKVAVRLSLASRLSGFIAICIKENAALTDTRHHFRQN